jgi:hypothetical protein
MNYIINTNESNDEITNNFTYIPYNPSQIDYVNNFSYSHVYNYWNGYQADTDYCQYYPQSSYQIEQSVSSSMTETYNYTALSPNTTVQSEQSSGYLTDTNLNNIQTKNTSFSSIPSLKENNSPVSVSNISQSLDSSFKRRRNHNQLPEEAVSILNEWFESHINHPYPSMDDKHRLAEKCGISVKQVNSWFCNRRNRSQNTKPKRIKRHLEQEITQVFNEFMHNPNKKQVMEKFKSTLKMHDIKL